LRGNWTDDILRLVSRLLWCWCIAHIFLNILRLKLNIRLESVFYRKRSRVWFWFGATSLPSSATCTHFPSGTYPEGPSFSNSLAKLLAKIQSLLCSLPVLEASSSERLPSAFTVVKLPFMLYFLSTPLLAVRVKQAGSGKSPFGTSSPTNVYRLFMKSQARPRSPATHIWN
jgi:hypothetical protein